MGWGVFEEMTLTVKELKDELSKFDGNKQVRVLFGMPTPILWLSHEDKVIGECMEGCTLYTDDYIELSAIDRIEYVYELLWHLQFFDDDLLVGNCDISSCNSYIEEVSDEVKDAEGNVVDTVFLINFAHMVG